MRLYSVTYVYQYISKSRIVLQTDCQSSPNTDVWYLTNELLIKLVVGQFNEYQRKPKIHSKVYIFMHIFGWNYQNSLPNRPNP